MKVQLKSFKEMKECGELPQPQLKTNSPEEQEYTRLKRQQLTGEGCSKKESFIRGYRSKDGDYAQLDCNEDGTDCDVSFFASDNSEDPDAIIKDRHFDTLADAEAYLADEGYFKESKAKKESGMTIDDYRIGEWVDWDGDSWTIVSKDEELDQVELENKDGDNTVWVDVDELDTEFDESCHKEDDSKEDKIREIDKKLKELEDQGDYDSDIYAQLSQTKNKLIHDLEAKDMGECATKEASNGFDILRDVEKDFYYIEGPDGAITDDDGNPLHFDSREDAEDYVDTMLLN